MYLNITRASFDPAVYEQIGPISREVEAAMRQLPGVLHLYQGINPVAGTVVVVSVWDSDEHAHFSRDALGGLIFRLLALGVQLEPPEVYEIMDDEGADDEGADEELAQSVTGPL